MSGNFTEDTAFDFIFTERGTPYSLLTEEIVADLLYRKQLSMVVKAANRGTFVLMLVSKDRNGVLTTLMPPVVETSISTNVPLFAALMTMLSCFVYNRSATISSVRRLYGVPRGEVKCCVLSEVARHLVVLAMQQLERLSFGDLTLQ